MADTTHNVLIRKHGEEEEGYIVPNHYVQGKFQVIDILQTQLNKEGYIGFSKGIILKYLIRGDEENDKKRVTLKAKFYLDELISFLSDSEKTSNKHLKPNYYKNNKLGIETIDIIEDQLTKEELIGFYQAMIIKYICRSSYKGHLFDDLNKAKYYLDKLVKFLEEETK